MKFQSIHDIDAYNFPKDYTNRIDYYHATINAFRVHFLSLFV